MVRNFATVVFTILFAVSAARISVDPIQISESDLPLVQTDCDVKPLPESDSNLVVLPIEKTNSGSDGAGADDQVKKSENDKMFRADLTPRSDFARFHAINRHFFAHSRPYRHFRNSFVMPRSRSEISHRNEGIVASETGDFDSRSFHRHGTSSRLKVKHDYGHHHHRHQQVQHHHHIHHNKEVFSMPKHKFVREKVKSPVHQHKELTNERKVSFMRSIRKFLKHTFD